MSDKDLIEESHLAEVLVLVMSEGTDPVLAVSVVNTIQRLARALEARQADEAARTVMKLIDECHEPSENPGQLPQEGGA